MDPRHDIILKVEHSLSSILFKFPSKSMAHWLRAQQAKVTLRPIFPRNLGFSPPRLGNGLFVVFSLSYLTLVTVLSGL